MFKILSMIKADFIKMKNTPFYWIHICLPIMGVVFFMVGYSFLSYDGTSKTLGYLKVILLLFPVLIGVLASMVIEQEAGAGRFKEMLGCVYGKQLSLISKTSMLLFSGLTSTIIAVGGFFIGFQFYLHENVLPASFYGYIILIIFGSQVFLYMFHIGLSLLWGAGASIGMGIFESLTAALMSTSLGDGIWQWIPCGWGIRLSTYFSLKYQSVNGLPEFNEGVKNSILFTIIFGILLIIWFNFYEGRKEK